MGIIGNIIHAAIKGIGNSSTVTINGQTYVGRNVVVNGNTVLVDGKDGTICLYRKLPYRDSARLKIIPTKGEAHVELVKIGQRVDGSVKSGSGDVDIGGGVLGNVSTLSGDIRHC